MSHPKSQEKTVLEAVQYKITPEQMGIKSSMIANIPISSISWKDFKGTLPEKKSYYAHINWHITYSYFIQRREEKRVKVIAKPHISNKSWVDPKYCSDLNLLRHEYGHYLIGCLCCLSFQKKVNENNERLLEKGSLKQMENQIRSIFRQNLKQFLQMEINYDEQTNHYYNRKEQQEWQQRIANQINEYYRIPFKERKFGNNKSSQPLSLQKQKDQKEIQIKEKDSQEDCQGNSSRSQSRSRNRLYFIKKSFQKFSENNMSCGERRKLQSEEGDSVSVTKKKVKKNDLILKNMRLVSALPPRVRRRSQKEGLILPNIQPSIQIR